MQSTLLASGLGFPEGPTILDDGRVVLCDGNTGELLVYDNGAVSAYARTGGSPWGTVPGSDGAIYVTQGGNVPGSGDVSAVSGIQRVNPDGTVELLCSQVAGHQLYGPNDLTFGPDGRLYFTESGSEQDFRFDVRSPGRLFAVDGSGDGEMLLELPGVYPNGIAFDRDQRLYWTESMAHRIRRLEDGKPVTFCQLSDDHVPDGMAFAADGRLFVATTVSQGVTVISPDGQVLAEINLGEHATNCAFDGPALYVTATGTADIEASERTGTFWLSCTGRTTWPSGLTVGCTSPSPGRSRTSGSTCAHPAGCSRSTGQAAARCCWNCRASTRTGSPSTATSGSTGPSRWRTASSMAHRVRRLEDGKPVTFCQLSDDHVPDGMAFAADGRLFVATTVSQGVTVISPDGQVLAEITLGEHATNCAFDGPALYVTATGTADIEASERTGTFWRVDTDADGGLELIPGRL